MPENPKPTRNDILQEIQERMGSEAEELSDALLESWGAIDFLLGRFEAKQVQGYIQAGFEQDDTEQRSTNREVGKQQWTTLKDQVASLGILVGYAETQNADMFQLIGEAATLLQAVTGMNTEWEIRRSRVITQSKRWGEVPLPEE